MKTSLTSQKLFKFRYFLVAKPYVFGIYFFGIERHYRERRSWSTITLIVKLIETFEIGPNYLNARIAQLYSADAIACPKRCFLTVCN